ncbi:MAG: spore coat protein U domain-containing protein [Deltaproteobacteria bacterium]|nr:spore coat protein U domain-containing protein [Deltaproteobacteria bacterium]
MSELLDWICAVVDTGLHSRPGKTITPAGNNQEGPPPVTTTVYGRIPPGQNVSVGSYGDTLTVTITW